MASIDLETLQSPVSADLPSGEDLEYDTLFVEMEQAAAGKPDQIMGDAVVEGEEPDWKLVQRNAITLLERSKDLRVCVCLCQAALRNESFAGLSTALQLTQLLTEAFWETLYPELDEDDDLDPTARVNTIMALTTAATMLRPIEQAPLLSVPMLGAVCWADIKPEAGEEDPQQASSEIQAIINNCELDQIADRRTAVADALQACAAIETFITSQVGVSRAPSLKPLRDLLKRIGNQLDRWWNDRGGDQAAGLLDQDDDADADNHEASETEAEFASDTEPRGNTPGSRPARGSAPINNVISSREEVISAIDKILVYYQRYEPSSPLPLLLVRAKRLATKSFIEILQDLIPEGLSRAHEIGGIVASDAGSSVGDTATHFDASDSYEADFPDADSSGTDDETDADDFFS
ncbi:hypothetical protein Pla52o_29740 [Novipirellula galeiformis]|uniref:ImpA N-terminal domain-containing protein n=1 Tax=Novipirellula galeiformis TaxID=2528004 RepID=A0A5C6CGJ0_9BACT|nr:type VI secretion system protein TssA [Novipirellula galeiformis]TWU23438.1 hypothetical protein Pla52o_29740 [Novipirellula galeiformis]